MSNKDENISREEEKEESVNREHQDENENKEEENKENEENKEEEENKENEENKEEEKEEEPEEEPFSYLDNANNQIIYVKEKLDDENNPFNDNKGKFKYSICVLLDNNESSSSYSLKKTLISIGNNLNGLKENLNIEAQEIVIFIFISEIKNYNNKLFTLNQEDEIEDKINEYIIQERTITNINEKNQDLANIKIFTINQIKPLSKIKSLSYYYEIINQIKVEKKIMFSSIMTAGIQFNENKLFELISFSYHSRNQHGIAVSSVEYKTSNLISMLCDYDKKRYNIYTLNYLNESTSAPISSQLCTITINDKILEILKNYYEKINKAIAIEYHDFNLALYLKEKNCLIKYINDNPGYIICSVDCSFHDYQQLYLERFSGYYGNFFNILSSFQNCNILQIIFLVFQLISISFEFILPSITAMIIYIIFYAAFKTSDYRISLFFTLLYLSLMFSSGYCSIVGKKVNKMKYTYNIINILMALLYLLSLICSIPAMHFAHEDKNPDLSGYKFNKAAISTIIIFTFIPYIIPLILCFSTLGGDIFLLLVYNLIFAPFAKINFNVAGVWGAIDVSKENIYKEIKSFYILIYLGINLFIGSLSFYNTDNKKKANCVMAFGIIYLVYNFVRSLAIIMEICFKKEETFNNQNLIINIKKDLNEKEDSDIHSEKESIKKSQQENNDDNIDNENNNKDKETNAEQHDDDGREVEVEQDNE